MIQILEAPLSLTTRSKTPSSYKCVHAGKSRQLLSCFSTHQILQLRPQFPCTVTTQATHSLTSGLTTHKLTSHLTWAHRYPASSWQKLTSHLTTAHRDPAFKLAKTDITLDFSTPQPSIKLTKTDVTLNFSTRRPCMKLTKAGITLDFSAVLTDFSIKLTSLTSHSVTHTDRAFNITAYLTWTLPVFSVTFRNVTLHITHADPTFNLCYNCWCHYDPSLWLVIIVLHPHSTPNGSQTLTQYWDADCHATVQHPLIENPGSLWSFEPSSRQK